MAKKEETVSMIDTFSEFKELKNIDRTTMVSVLEESFRSVIAKMFELPQKRSVNLHCSKVEVLAIPLKRDRQAHAMTKHSIDIALKSRFILKSASFLL